MLTNPSNVTLPAPPIVGQIIDVPPATLSGSVYVDSNNDGIRQLSEAGIGNVRITASATINGVPASQFTFTRADGTYTLVGLQPNTPYAITETQPGFFVDGKDTGPMGPSQANDKFTGVVLTPSQQAVGYNFGEMGLRAEFAMAFFNRRAFFSSTVVGTQFGTMATPVNLQNGDVWISFDGGWQGPATITAAVASASQGSVTMTLYDINLSAVAFSTPTGTGGAQLQFNGSGATYFLKVSGSNSNVSISTNLPALNAGLVSPQITTTSSSSSTVAPANNISPPSTNPPASPASGVATTFSSSSMAAPPASENESEDAADAALADEDDWVMQLLTA